MSIKSRRSTADNEDRALPAGARRDTMVDSVLIVSHNGSSVRQIEQDLNDAGFLVLTASDQKQAIDQLLAERPRLVVADCNTPNTDTPNHA